MDKKRIVLEHREALSAYEDAKKKLKNCRNSKKCGNGACDTCPFIELVDNAKASALEKAEALRIINAQTVSKNDDELDKRVDARMARREARDKRKSTQKPKEEVKVAKKVIAVDQYEKLVAQGLKMPEIAEKLGVSTATLYARKSVWMKQGLLTHATKPTAPETKPVAVVPEVESAVETTKAPEVEASVNYEALYKKMLENFNAQQAELKAEVEHNQVLQEKARAYEQHAEELEEQLLTEREEIARLRAHNKYLKHAQYASDVSEQENTRINQLELEIAEMAEEVSNACYEKAEIERKYDRLVRMAAPILKDWTEALLKEAEG